MSDTREQRFRRAYRGGARGEKFAHDAGKRRFQLSARDDVVDEADAQRVVGIEAFPGER
jgi:sarcosine oxidase delta subunit